MVNNLCATFRVDRASPWQQLFVSSRPNGAAGWTSSDVSIRYGLDGGRSYTLEEVGSIYHVTRERIRQIEAKALRKLRQNRQLRDLRD